MVWNQIIKYELLCQNALMALCEVEILIIGYFFSKILSEAWMIDIFDKYQHVSAHLFLS